MPIRIKISKRAIVNAVVDILDRNQNSSEAQKLTKIVGDQASRQGAYRANLLGDRSLNNARKIERLEIAQRQSRQRG